MNSISLTNVLQKNSNVFLDTTYLGHYKKNKQPKHLFTLTSVNQRIAYNKSKKIK